MIITNTTPLLNLETSEYPVFLPQIKLSLPNLSFSFAPTDTHLFALGYVCVNSTPKPLGEVVVEGHPDLALNGKYVQTWTTRPFNEEEIVLTLQSAKANLGYSLGILKAEALERGAPYFFEGSAVPLHVQLRDQDRASLLQLGIKAESLRVKGIDTPVFNFRTCENVMRLLTPVQMISVVDSAFSSYTRILEATWALKAHIANAQALENLPDLPFEL